MEDSKASEEESQPSLNLSDVLSALKEFDPNYTDKSESEIKSGDMLGNDLMYNQLQSTNSLQPQSSVSPNSIENGTKPYVEIIEQPAPKALRFRYECEGRSAGSIPGEHSKADNKTFPTIKVHGYKGKALVIVSCVTKKEPYRPHPHKLVGKEICKNGVGTMEVDPETMCATFSNLGIQCVKKKEIESALIEREKKRVDPFKTGFAHRTNPSDHDIDLNAVRLCFQVFLWSEGRYKIALRPVVSNIIYDKKANNDLIIVTMSAQSGPATGGFKVILLCEKVNKDDIIVNFYEEDADGRIIWEQEAEIILVHKQVALLFNIPKYRIPDIDKPVEVKTQLKRRTDSVTSDSIKFEYVPALHEDSVPLRRKRQKHETNFPLDHNILAKPIHIQPNTYNYSNMEYFGQNDQQQPTIKLEPRDTTSQHMSIGNYLIYRNQMESPSPQQLPAISPQYNPQLDYQGTSWNITNEDVNNLPGTSQQSVLYTNNLNWVGGVIQEPSQSHSAMLSMLNNDANVPLEENIMSDSFTRSIMIHDPSNDQM